jgi:tetratricopeptide (TPR) repeat protein
MKKLRQFFAARDHARWNALGVIAAIAVIAVASNVVVLGNDFINYDDNMNVTDNAYVRAGLTLDGIKTAFTRIHFLNWLPVMTLSFMLDHDLFGLNPAGYHAVNLLLHAANSALLFIVLLRMTGALWPAALTGALFAAHPSSVEAVAWVSARKDVLSALFWLLAMYFYAGYVKAYGSPADGFPGGRRRALVNYALMVAAVILGLMSKQMLVTLPFALLLLDWWPLKRFIFKSGVETAPAGSVSRISGLMIEKLPLIMLSVLFSVVVMLLQEKAMAINAEISLSQRIGNAMFSYVAYIRQLLWPAGLCVIYPLESVGPIKALASASALAAVTAVALYYAGRLRWFAVGWFWYLGTMAPVSGVVQAGMQARADRYLYVPRIGLFIIAAWGLCALAEKLKAEKTAVVAAVLIVTVFSALSCLQAGRWKNSKTLYEHCLDVTDGNYIVLFNLGCHHEFAGDLDKAVEYYKKAIAINPFMPGNYIGLGRILADRGDAAGALALFDRALKYIPREGNIHDAIAGIHATAGKFDLALEHFLVALKYNPGSAEINYNLADTLVRLGRAEESLKYYSRALEINPYLAEAHNNIGYVLNSMGKTDEAEMHLRKAVEIKPDFAHAHFTLGMILLNRRDFGRAEMHFLKAVEITPDFFEAHNALGMALLKLGRYDEAARHFRRAVEINPGFAEARSNLAALSQNPGVK